MPPFSQYSNMKFPDPSDPANAPKEYPKMLYHPKGETEIVAAGNYDTTPVGPEMRNRHVALVNMVVNNAEEEAAAVAEGWHDHPAKAVAAGKGLPIPTMAGKPQQLIDLEAKMRREIEATLRAEFEAKAAKEATAALEKAKAAANAAPKPTTPIAAASVSGGPVIKPPPSGALALAPAPTVKLV